MRRTSCVISNNPSSCKVNAARLIMRSVSCFEFRDSWPSVPIARRISGFASCHEIMSWRFIGYPDPMAPGSRWPIARSLTTILWSTENWSSILRKGNALGSTFRTINLVAT